MTIKRVQSTSWRSFYEPPSKAIYIKLHIIMLIPGADVIRILNHYGIKVTGVLHVGAHECEEMDFYRTLGLTPNDVTWLDAIPQKVEEARAKGMPNVYQALVTDKDDELIKFNISNNVQSSSIFDLVRTRRHTLRLSTRRQWLPPQLRLIRSANVIRLIFRRIIFGIWIYREPNSRHWSAAKSASHLLRCSIWR